MSSSGEYFAPDSAFVRRVACPGRRSCTALVKRSPVDGFFPWAATAKPSRTGKLRAGLARRIILNLSVCADGWSHAL
ncbi:hypothetical protein ACLD9V_03490 [Streptomyces lincolnensis]|uniref:hypothetical protein n=1 Tax=Streptomyces lincolnensis TaxID=1915 RepID=UPI00139672EB|nr:hypothetical protein [Streptomyces lincolnensis]